MICLTTGPIGPSPERGREGGREGGGREGGRGEGGRGGGGREGGRERQREGGDVHTCIHMGEESQVALEK